MNYQNVDLKKDTKEFKSYITKEKTNARNTILKTYDVFLSGKYKVDINQKAINSIKNLFQ